MSVTGPSEYQILVTMLERTETPFRSHSTEDCEHYIVTVRQVVLFAFNGEGKCLRVLTET